MNLDWVRAYDDCQKLILLGALLLPQSAFAKELHFSTGFTPPISDFYKRVFKEADKRLDGVTISFEVLPAERLLQLVNSGVNDGECCCIPAMSLPYVIKSKKGGKFDSL